MALSIQPSFTGGELDPALHDRTNFQKYKSGLATARNVSIGKTGRIISRPGRKHLGEAFSADHKIVIWPMPQNLAFLELGPAYIKAKSMDNTVSDSAVTGYTEDDLENLRFVQITDAVTGIFLEGSVPRFFQYIGDGSGGLITNPFVIPAAPTYVSESSTGTGYVVDYAFTIVKGGQESSILERQGSTNLPISVAENTIHTNRVGSSGTSDVTEMRVYRRPTGAGAYGYLGSSTSFFVSGGDLRCTFKDVGYDADYSHQPPTINPTLTEFDLTDPASDFYSGSAILYQQRLLMNYGGRLEASRPGFPYNFYRDFPYSSDSSLSLQIYNGATGERFKILNFIESEGLVVFTNQGVWVSTGSLSPTNLNMEKRGSWVIDKVVPPLAIPGGVLFVDSLTNTIRSLSFSQENATYTGEEVSVFSEHLFKEKLIKSWAFEDGYLPLLWVVFNDGTYASFTYERDQQMRAWTRHDSGTDIEYVTSINLNDYWGVNETVTDLLASFSGMMFVVNKNGTRFIELGVNRYPSARLLAVDTETHMGPSIALMDSMVSWKSLINDSLGATDSFYVTPVTVNDWEGNLNINCTTTNVFVAGDVGETFRYFNPDDNTSVDLEVIEYVNAKHIRVTPSCEFPYDKAEDIRLYRTASVFTGLDHMDDEYVSIIVDGYVVASPNNDVDNYQSVQVIGGQITLPNSKLGAIVHIGRPITSDIETLEIDSVEQRPVFFESKICNKIYVKVHKTRGLFIGNKFPSNDLVEGMERLIPSSVDYDLDDPILGNRYDQPKTERVEVTTPGDWYSNGKIYLRNVDPIHFEILSITPDLEDLRR